MRLPRPRKLVLTVLLIFAALHALYIGVVAILSVRLRAHNPAQTALMIYRRRADGLPRPPTFTPLAELPDTLVRSVLYIEDSGFWRHHGFDLESIRFAIRLNRRLGYRAYGGSTITQQLARTLYLVPDKTYLRKYLELWAAVVMEAALTKVRILELYLNTAEWGVGVYGVADAARASYGLAPAELDTDQISRLVTILASPRRYTIHTFERNEIIRRRHEAILRYLGHEAVRRRDPPLRRLDAAPASQ